MWCGVLGKIDHGCAKYHLSRDAHRMASRSRCVCVYFFFIFILLCFLSAFTTQLDVFLGLVHTYSKPTTMKTQQSSPPGKTRGQGGEIHHSIALLQMS